MQPLTTRQGSYSWLVASKEQVRGLASHFCIPYEGGCLHTDCQCKEVTVLVEMLCRVHKASDEK